MGNIPFVIILMTCRVTFFLSVSNIDGKISDASFAEPVGQRTIAEANWKPMPIRLFIPKSQRRYLT